MAVTDKVIHFPAQKKPLTQKGKEWRKQNIDAAEDYAFNRHAGLRKSTKNKQINYDLYSDILDQADVERTCNPFKLKSLSSPAQMQNYPIANPKIDLLVGEALKRKLDIRVRVSNADAVSQKEKGLKEAFNKLIMEQIEEEELDEKAMQKRLSEFERWRTYEYQDHREEMATHILTHLQQKLKIDGKFAKGFKDALLVAEEIYQVDVVAGEPILERLNPKHVNVIRSGESPYIEDADVITIKSWYSPGRIIDEYHDELTPAEIDMIETGSFAGDGGSDGIGEKKPTNLDASTFDPEWFGGDDFGNVFDEDGNIRIVKVYWKSRRKMLKVTKLNAFGNEEVTLEDENFKIDKDLGEKAKVLWINEWWEGHKIGGSSTTGDDRAIYVRMQPRPIQFRNMENPSKCSPGIIGTIYQTNDNGSVSLMDRMKPYQYMYNVLMYNTEIAVAKNYGKIMALDLSKVPENWKIDQWLSFAQGMNLAVYDSFKEGNKGAATGKLAGSQQAASQPVIDMEMGNTIQLYMSMLGYVKAELGEISGVSGARQGQISNREAVGNVEREVIQSSHITEYWFAEHEATQIRVLEALLETAKFAWKDKENQKVQYVLDEGSTAIFEIDGEQFNEADYGIAVTTGSMNDNLRESLKQLAHAGMQNGMINFSQLLDIMTTNSVSAIKRKIEKSEEDAKAGAAEAQQQEMQAAQQQLQQQAQIEQAKAQAEVEKQLRELDDNDKNRMNAILLKQLDIQAKASNEASADSIEKLKLDAQKLSVDSSHQTEELAETIRANKAKEDNDRKKIASDAAKKAAQSTK
tara:strand:+ start:5454 stop:7862 length:2409 start_codon:yes stop_codon:yes gene_type:complete